MGWMLLSACGPEEPRALGVLSTGGGDSGRPMRLGALRDPDGGLPDSGTARDSGFSFAHLATDAGPVPMVDGEYDPAPMTPAEVPWGWTCAPVFGLDAICDCGCGVFDGACDATACVGPGCSAAGCDVCHDAAGAFIPCGELDTWTCAPGRVEDGVCDCGCGLPDPDCDASGCKVPGCDAPACERCVDGAGRPARCGPADDLRCDEEVFDDGACDCGCGQPDPDCGTGACTDAGCFGGGCDVCHGADGEEDVCGAASDGHCAAATRTDGVCDCGCGLADPDCGGAGCQEPGCRDDACQVCHDSFGRVIPCPDQWSCLARQYRDGTCDCGCGAVDPDCQGQGCGDGGCQADACERRFDAEGRQLPSDGFACDPETFDAGDGCHCGCGAPDPDCGPWAGCTTPGCRDRTCDVCFDGDGAQVPCTWTCDDALLGDGRCDCGCGTRDPDCAGRPCHEPGCFAPACETCHDESGEAIACDRGACAPGFDRNGVCDCGCREPDPECSGGACVGPGCSASACGVCHAADGSSIRCQDWSCSFEQQGGADGCNCGCGAIDPDCAPQQGCAEPGCVRDACTTCRDVSGAPMECNP
ncbi:MAG: hypothetical protein OXR73_31260 [Myxococcales bacterium]|nr:hypothetical protein [Myxococcales bacterium]